MRTTIFGITAAMLLLGGAAYADTTGAASTTALFFSVPPLAQATTPAHSGRPHYARNPAWPPSYEMRPDGLMINGLLPEPGWQG